MRTLPLTAVRGGGFYLSRCRRFGSFLGGLALAQLFDALADLGLHQLDALGVALSPVLPLPPLVAGAGDPDCLLEGLGLSERGHARASEDDHCVQVRGFVADLDGLALAAI